MLPGLKLDQVLQVTFFLGHRSYLISKISGSGYDLDSALNHVLIIVFCPNQSNELSVLGSDDGSISTDSPQDIWKD